MKEFGDLTTEKQNELFQAWLNDRDCIELYTSNVWIACPEPNWLAACIYRIKPVNHVLYAKQQTYVAPKGKFDAPHVG